MNLYNINLDFSRKQIRTNTYTHTHAHTHTTKKTRVSRSRLVASIDVSDPRVQRNESPVNRRELSCFVGLGAHRRGVCSTAAFIPTWPPGGHLPLTRGSPSIARHHWPSERFTNGLGEAVGGDRHRSRCYNN